MVNLVKKIACKMLSLVTLHAYTIIGLPDVSIVARACVCLPVCRLAQK